VIAAAGVGARLTGPGLAERLSTEAQAAIAKAGAEGQVKASFEAPSGAPGRHPVLRVTGGARLDEATRDAVAKAVAQVRGVGGVRWADGTALARTEGPPVNPLHCQEDVEALLRARTIRFEEASARIDAASRGLIAEVADALRPCLGSTIAITGHTDVSGSAAANFILSQARAEAVRLALVQRGIPNPGLRARGVGSREPVPGLDAADPANRRIEFSVIATEPIAPTPVDTPGPR
jgi:OOP family OmpA-OmpF porin